MWGWGRNFTRNLRRPSDVFSEADEALGFSLSQLCFSGPDSDLKLTENTQPAILTVSVAALRVLESETGLKPDFVAGHSLGEYTALVCAGALELPGRGKSRARTGETHATGSASGVGAMAVILGLGAEVVRSLCEAVSNGEVVAPANYNGGGQIVIAGSKAAVARAMSIAKERGARRVLDLPGKCSLSLPAYASGRRRIKKVWTM